MALFHTIKFAKDAVWADKSTLITSETMDVTNWQQIPVNNFNLDLTMTYPLLSIQAWLDATNNNQDLVQIRQVLESDNHLAPAMFTEKCYFRLCQNNQLEAKGGLVYYFKWSKIARFWQLCLKVVLIAMRATVIAVCTCHHLEGIVESSAHITALHQGSTGQAWCTIQQKTSKAIVTAS